MVAKRPSQALALLLALPSAAFALGLGDIHLLSAPNSPLDAEIELVDVAPDEINSMQAQLASRDTFARYGLDYPGYLSGVQLRTARTADGRQVIKLKSTDAVPDPVIKLLVEVNWARGHLVREYTVTADAPVQSATQLPNEASTHLVQRGETLSRIAASVSGTEATSAHARSWMLAIYQANPHAFEKNMNRLRSGAVLRIPDAATAAAVSPSEASAEIRRQYAAWRGTAAAPDGSTASATPGRLKLVTPAQNASTGAASGGATSSAQSGEVAALQSQLRDLQSQVAAQKRLLEMKDADLASLQAQLAAKPQNAPPAAALSADVAAKPASPVAQKGPPAGSRSLRDTLGAYWWLLPAILLAVVGLAWRLLRARRASQFDDSLGRLAVAGAGADLRSAQTAGDVGDTGAAGTFEHGAAANEAPMSAAAMHATEPPPQEAPSVVATPVSPEHVANDETMSSETAPIHLNQGDPLAEADFHLAYGLYDQAADLIRIGIAREPARGDLKLKLLEVFFVAGNRDSFVQSARELAQTSAEAAPGEWEKVVVMGKQLAPDDPLFCDSPADFHPEGSAAEEPTLPPHEHPTIPALLESALRQRSAPLGTANGGHNANGGHSAHGADLDLDVDTVILPDTTFRATQRLPSEELALSDVEPVTLNEASTKLDLARAYMDMGDPEGARNILEEVLTEGSATQRQEAERLMESLP